MVHFNAQLLYWPYLSMYEFDIRKAKMEKGANWKKKKKKMGNVFNWSLVLPKND